MLVDITSSSKTCKLCGKVMENMFRATQILKP